MTKDEEVGELVFRSCKPSSRVILLRLDRDIPSAMTMYFFSIIENLREKLSRKFVVLAEKKYRARKIN